MNHLPNWEMQFQRWQVLAIFVLDSMRRFSSEALNMFILTMLQSARLAIQHIARIANMRSYMRLSSSSDQRCPAWLRNQCLGVDSCLIEALGCDAFIGIYSKAEWWRTQTLTNRQWTIIEAIRVIEEWRGREDLGGPRNSSHEIVINKQVKLNNCWNLSKDWPDWQAL